MFVQIVAPPGSASAEPADCLRSFVFDANLAAQEASGDPAASGSPRRVLQRLQGSTESRTYLFGLTDSALGPAGELGLPVISAAEPSPEIDFDGFIHISLPLLEETENADIECVLAADLLPLPGEDLEPEALDVTRALAREALRITRQLGRTTAQVGMLYPPDADHTYDPMSQAYLELGFRRKHAERQMFVEIAPTPPVVGAQVWPDYDIPEELLDDVLRLLTLASTDAVYGDLSVEPIVWTRQRLNEAHARLRSRKAHTLLVGIVEKGRVVALTELSRHGDADPEVCEWTLTVTDREQRSRGLATRAKQHAQYAVAHHWPDVRRAYCSVAQADPAMNALYKRLGAHVISASSAYELTVENG
ncbi:GNAT family acetyltransferase [Corynebacterium sp. HMSC035E02]|uniref:GNAT family N-acetyltransferase n=1 Tax=Corynebacterium sp. HMSC035E02 TaxID=1715114 RepID=UPI0008A9E76A|nr:GNAT family N-acetyltransferase [Corynebacterium sp. HMSC035E02]OHO56126.1 GNAT family acetyltransferase [Corynebacterium sp. HMSC035E02]